MRNSHVSCSVLVVEDDPRRIEWFRKQLEGRCCLDVFEEAAGGINAVKNSKYDLIFLDHDLGGRIFVPSDDPNTGYQVAKVLKDSPNRKTRVIVHSYNPDGVANMLAVIGEHAEPRPFGSFEIAFENGMAVPVVKEIKGA